MKKKNKLVIHGAIRGARGMPPKLQEIKDILDNAKEHECFTAVELCNRVGTGMEYLRHRGMHLPNGHRALRCNSYVYANKKTIQNLKDGLYDEFYDE